ncbi:MAG: NADPH-dependent FMN reductase [Christensenellales bacterium]|jgi:chromate reductase
MKKIAVLVGSLRKASFTRRIAQKAVEMLPENFEAEFIDLNALPFYNQDFEITGEYPESYIKFRQKIKEADGVIFATPEYNRSFTAPLKNAIDIASRPTGQNLWSNKPGLLFGVSPGNMGAFGATTHLRQVLMCLNVKLMQSPEIYICNVHKLLDKDGNLNPDTAKFLQGAVDSFARMM